MKRTSVEQTKRHADKTFDKRMRELRRQKRTTAEQRADNLTPNLDRIRQARKFKVCTVILLTSHVLSSGAITAFTDRREESYY